MASRSVPLYKSQWIALHRHDLPINSEEWNDFTGVLHAGVQRQSRIIQNFPHLYGVIYVFPFNIISRSTNRPLDFLNRGNLFYGYEGSLPRVPSSYQGDNRYQWEWVDWEHVDIDQIIERWSPHIPRFIQYWMIDLVPEWYRTCGRDSEMFFAQVHGMYKCLRGIKDVPVFGNIYQGGEHADFFLEIVDGLLFENWRWFWANGAPLTPDRIQLIEENIQRALSHPKKFVVLQVPSMPSKQIPDAVKQIRIKLKLYGADRVLFCEYRPAEGTESVRKWILKNLQ